MIFITHSYLDIGNKRVTKDGYKISPQNSGQAIWEKLIYPSSNIRLVLCGHVGRGTGEYENNVAYRVDKNSAGKDVSQMTFNVQYVGGGPEGNGGDGWLAFWNLCRMVKRSKYVLILPCLGFQN